MAAARPYFVQSSYLENNDCLGGHMSSSRTQPNRPVVTTDTMQCLTLDDMYFVERLEIQITKTGNYFELYISGYNSVTGWISWLIENVAIGVGDSHTYVFDALYKGGYITVTRTMSGSDGVLRAHMTRNAEPPYMRPDLPVTNTDPYYACLYLVVPEEQYLYELNGPYHWMQSAWTSTRYTTPVADHWTAPAGASWTNTTSIDGTVAVGTYPVWVRLTEANSLLIKFSDTSGDYIEAPFYQRTYDTTIKKYLVYGAYDGSLTGGTLLGQGDTLPVNVTLTPPGTGTREYRVRLVEQTPYSVVSQNVLLDQILIINAAGADVTAPPPPQSVTVESGVGKVAYVTATITQSIVGAQIIALMFTIDGDTQEVLTSQDVNEYTVLSGDIDWGDTVTASVTCIDANLRESTATTDSAVIYFDVESAPEYLYAQHGYYLSSFRRNTMLVSAVHGNAILYGNYDYTTVYYGDDLCATITDVITLASGWTITNDAVGGASTDFIEDATGYIFYLGDGANRRIKFDVANKIMTVPAMTQPIALDCPVVAAVYQHGVYTRFQAAYAGRCRTWLMFDATNTYMMEIREQESE